jgi:hypothetical protein
VLRINEPIFLPTLEKVLSLKLALLLNYLKDSIFTTNPYFTKTGSDSDIRPVPAFWGVGHSGLFGRATLTMGLASFSGRTPHPKIGAGAAGGESQHV